ncbi:caspase family protein [uncultured Thiothrix sp.]|uniref:caspase family protein n=1 Tax=uncultured Thiothrix sp. TaxID=223185 RepID=UPI00262AB1AF|nr:caspase family protein [uncultured Thiothrix sp.]
MKKILLVDDIKETHKEIRDYFDGDYKILYSQDVDTAINILENNDNIFCALIDLKLDYKSEYGGIDLIEYIQKNNINIKFIIFSAYSLQEESIKNAIIKKTNISDGDYNQYTKNQVIKGHGNYLIEIEQKLKELSDLSKSSYDFGKYFSFLFAINTYEDQKIEDLEKPIIDAEKLKKILEEKYNFKTELMTNPSRSSIINKLINIREIYNNYDNILIFFAGHGDWDSDGNFGYWLPSDAKKDDRSSWIANCEINNYLNALKNKHVLLIVDACFSGGIEKELNRAISKNTFEELHKSGSRIALTSCAIQNTPDNSIFLQNLYHILEVNENTINLDKIFADLKNKVIESPHKEDQQTLMPRYLPLKGHPIDGDFIFNIF